MTPYTMGASVLAQSSCQSLLPATCWPGGSPRLPHVHYDIQTMCWLTSFVSAQGTREEDDVVSEDLVQQDVQVSKH